jgi:hypothetical protein
VSHYRKHGRNRILAAIILLSSLNVLLILSQIASAQKVAQPSPESIEEIVSDTLEQDESDSVEEIIVIGEKPLHALRREVYRAEENFFDVFNSLNQDDEFDVRCFYETPSFTRIRRHVCRANFVTDATSAESARFLGKAVGPVLPSDLVVKRKKERFREIMETLVAEKPELLQSLSEYTNARQTLELQKDARLEK